MRQVLIDYTFIRLCTLVRPVLCSILCVPLPDQCPGQACPLWLQLKMSITMDIQIDLVARGIQPADVGTLDNTTDAG